MLCAMPGPCAARRPSAASPRRRLRATSTRRAPRAANLSAAIRPIPDVAPVMTTVLPRMGASVRIVCGAILARGVRSRAPGRPGRRIAADGPSLIQPANHFIPAPFPPRLAMIPRYTRPEMAAIWDPQTRFRIWFEIEAHAADAMAELGVIPKAAAKAIRD